MKILREKKGLFAVIVLSLVLAGILVWPLSGIARAGSLADYGDAPDNSPAYDNPSVTGRFPSFYNTTNTIAPRRGPFAQIVDEVWLSTNVTATSSTTTVEADALTVDLDFDDAYPLYAIDPITGDGMVLVRVAASPSATRTLWYLNVVMDLDRNGIWRREPILEWVGYNIPVQLNPGEARTVEVGPFPVLTLGDVWTRIAVTDTTIAPEDFGGQDYYQQPGWDGSGPNGGFAIGEIEDWLLDPVWFQTPPGATQPPWWPPTPGPGDPPPTWPPPPPPPDTKAYGVRCKGSGGAFKPGPLARYPKWQYYHYCDWQLFELEIRNIGNVPGTLTGIGVQPKEVARDIDGDPIYGVTPGFIFGGVPVTLNPGQTATIQVWMHVPPPPDGKPYPTYPCPDNGWGNIAGRWDFVFSWDSPGDPVIWDMEPVWEPPSRCFIATAAYGTPMAEEVEVLREFRDKYLLTTPVGQALVDIYYKVSPPMAEFITEHPSLKSIVRVGLLPAVAMSTVVVNTTPAEKAAIIGLLVLVSVALAVWVTRRRGRRLGDTRGQIAH